MTVYNENSARMSFLLLFPIVFTGQSPLSKLIAEFQLYHLPEIGNQFRKRRVCLLFNLSFNDYVKERRIFLFFLENDGKYVSRSILSALEFPFSQTIES